jgi:carnitine O-acetyltransferase
MATVSKVESIPPTFAYQKKLPKLPIPPLEDTCRRYLRALEALQDRTEHETTKKAVQAFLENDGPVIHEKLKTWAEDKDRYASDDPLAELC